MKSLICLVFLLLGSSLAGNCFNGDLYAFTQGYAFYQVNTGDGSVSPNNVSTNCYPIGATTNNGNNVIVSCIDRNSQNTYYMTVEDNKIVSSVDYHSPCSTNLIVYDEKRNYIWAYYLRQYYYNSTNGWNEGTVIAVDATTGNTISNTSWVWNQIQFMKPAPVVDNGTCTLIVNGQFSFINGENFYVISSSSVAEFDISKGNAQFVSKYSVGDGALFQGWAYDSKNSMAYAVSKTDLYQFAVSNAWNYTIVNSEFPNLYTSSLATMDATNSNYLVFTSTGFNGLQLNKFDVESANVSTITIQSDLNPQAIVAYQYDSCAQNNNRKDRDRIVEIVVPVVVGGTIIIGIVVFFARRHRRRHHYHPINSHHGHH